MAGVATFTLICFGFASSRFGMLSVSLPKRCNMICKSARKKHVRGGFGWQLLVRPQMTSLSAEVSCFQAFELMPMRAEYVGSGIETFACVHDQVELVQLRPLWIQEVRWDTARSSIQHGRELWQVDRYLPKLACGATSKDDPLNRITRHFRIRIRVELNDRSRWRRQFNSRRVTTPGRNLLS
jgi:hypothetical protein